MSELRTRDASAHGRVLLTEPASGQVLGLAVASSMEIDAVTFRTIAKTLLPRATTLSPQEAAAIVQVAELTVGIDLDEDTDESRLVQQVARHVCAIGGIRREDVAVVSPLPLDEEERTIWIQRLANELGSTGARELAYALSYILSVGDQELAPIESSLIDELQLALGIDDDRASDLAATASAIVTPEELEELEEELPEEPTEAAYQEERHGRSSHPR